MGGVGGGERESYPGTPEQFVTLEWLLSYMGGPPLIAGEFSGRWVGKQREEVRGRGLTQAQPVRPLAGQTGGWKTGGGWSGRTPCLPRLRLPRHAYKTIACENICVIKAKVEPLIWAPASFISLINWSNTEEEWGSPSHSFLTSSPGWSSVSGSAFVSTC